VAHLVGLAASFASTKVYANADSRKEAGAAMRRGAAGIGLCRIEHVLAAAGAVPHLRRLLGECDPAQRTAILDEVTGTLTDRLGDILAESAGKPVTIRLLDIPRHELLGPVIAARDTGRGTAEVNPMMGTRGVRDFLLVPDLAVAQVRAIARAHRRAATYAALARTNILVPMVSFPEEFRRARRIIEEVLTEEMGDDAPRPAIGCMIEVPRAALCAAELAAEADFLSIGSNDLTQFTLAISRDDGQADFLGLYHDDRVIDRDPFAMYDEAGVGQLVRLCVEQARGRRPDIPIALCGEHAGDASSLLALVPLGLDYVSCTPQRVPLARFTVGHAGVRYAAAS
jgi:pyruvate,orthophosphate dikinase